MKTTVLALTMIFLPIIIALMAIIGEVKCIVKFCQCDFKPSYKAEVIYGVGSVTGLGCVLGYIDIDDKPESK